MISCLIYVPLPFGLWLAQYFHYPYWLEAFAVLCAWWMLLFARKVLS